MHFDCEVLDLNANLFKNAERSEFGFSCAKLTGWYFITKLWLLCAGIVLLNYLS